jgi:hypothetical protein
MAPHTHQDNTKNEPYINSSQVSRLDLPDSEQGVKAASFEDGNELSGSI